jgi:hypothetical protein
MIDDQRQSSEIYQTNKRFDQFVTITLASKVMQQGFSIISDVGLQLSLGLIENEIDQSRIIRFQSNNQWSLGLVIQSIRITTVLKKNLIVSCS